MHDLSVPIFIQGRHWGGLRLGYQPETVVSAATRQPAPVAA
jgi:methyl-accepting chemotaxis protein